MMPVPRRVGGLGVEVADRVGAVGQAQREGRHVELGLVAVDAEPELEDALDRDAAVVEQRPGDAPDEVGIEALVAGRDRRVDREHAVAPDRRPRRRRASSPAATCSRARSASRNAEWPSLRCQTAGARPSARIARTPPMPRTSSWWRRISRPRTYRMLVIGRSASAFSGRSVSSSRTGTRPTWATQTATDRSRPGSSTVTVSGRPDASWTRPSGSRRQVVVGVVVLLVAVGIDRLAEVALAIEQPDADRRQGHVAGRLHVVAGEDAEAARVDAERFVEAVLGAEVGDRAAQRVGVAALEPVVGAVGHVARRTRPGRRGTRPGTWRHRAGATSRSGR